MLCLNRLVSAVILTLLSGSHSSSICILKKHLSGTAFLIRNWFEWLKGKRRLRKSSLAATLNATRIQMKNLQLEMRMVGWSLFIHTARRWTYASQLNLSCRAGQSLFHRTAPSVRFIRVQRMESFLFSVQCTFSRTNSSIKRITRKSRKLHSGGYSIKIMHVLKISSKKKTKSASISTSLILLL